MWESRERAVLAARVAADKRGTGTVVLDVGSVLHIVDWFVVTSVANIRLVQAIAEEVEAALKGAGGGPIRVEGLADAAWVLLDFGDVVVHVFLDEVRSYYDLERLWGDVPRLDWEGEPAPSMAGE
ncbi:ribosome silencing factor [soil metagenome]